MTPRARSQRAPRRIIGSWCVATVTGAAVVLATGGSLQAAPTTLGPSTLAGYLQRAVGPGAHDIRVNGVYGSAHDGAWQFVAHITWRDSRGAVHGGTTDLPILAGTRTTTSPFGTERLAHEEAMGWPLPTLRRVFGGIRHSDASLALVELQITPAAASLVTCAARVARKAACEVLDAAGHATSHFMARLTNEPTAGPLAVRRAADS
jgi:hypothetical protein